MCRRCHQHHLNFAFVADVATRDVRGCDEFDAFRWVTAGELEGIDCPRNVRELARLALRGAPCATPRHPDTRTGGR